MVNGALSIPEIEGLTGRILVYHASLPGALPVQGSKPVIENRSLKNTG